MIPLARGERSLTTYVAATCGSITDIPAGDGIRCCVERLEDCAGGRTLELHNSILARSQAVEDPARVDNDSAGDGSALPILIAYARVAQMSTDHLIDDKLSI